MELIPNTTPRVRRSKYDDMLNEGDIDAQQLENISPEAALAKFPVGDQGGEADEGSDSGDRNKEEAME